MKNHERFQNLIGFVLSLSVGMAIGIFGHYLLYRLMLPVQPFIYVAF